MIEISKNFGQILKLSYIGVCDSNIKVAYEDLTLNK